MPPFGSTAIWIPVSGPKMDSEFLQKLGELASGPEKAFVISFTMQVFVGQKPLDIPVEIHGFKWIGQNVLRLWGSETDATRFQVVIDYNMRRKIYQFNYDPHPDFFIH